MIIVTGATGQLGRAIVENLVQRVPASQIGASARDPKKASGLSRLGVRVRKGDFSQPETLKEAFEGASQVLIVSSNARAYGGDPLSQHRAAIDAARSAGAKRILYTSHMAASSSSEFAPAKDHASTEEMLRESGLKWTALRNGFYASSVMFMMAEAFKTGVHEGPADGKVAWTAHADLAEGAAVLLADEGRFDGPTPPLTGPETFDFSDLAQIAADVIGRPIRRQVLSDDDARAKLVASGAPPRSFDHLIGFYRASRNGEFAPVDPTLEGLIGHRPTSVREVIARKV